MWKSKYKMNVLKYLNLIKIWKFKYYSIFWQIDRFLTVMAHGVEEDVQTFTLLIEVCIVIIVLVTLYTSKNKIKIF